MEKKQGNREGKGTTIFRILVIPVLVVVSLFFTFIFNAVYQMTMDKLFLVDNSLSADWYPLMRHGFFLLLIALISITVYKSGQSELFKAVFTAIPCTVLMITAGMYLEQWKNAVYAAGVFTYLILLLIFYVSKKTWMFYYSITFTGLSLLAVSILKIHFSGFL